MRRAPLALLLCSLPVSAAAQSAPSRGWVDVNVARVVSQQDDQNYELATPLFDETARAATSYPALPSATGLGIAAGVNFHPRIGVSVGWDRINYEYGVGMAVAIPHPVVFNRTATATDVTASLERSDSAIDLSLVYTPAAPDAWRVRIFGGPTYFKVTQGMVGGINFSQQFTLSGINLVDITTYDAEDVEGSTWGFNAGADVAYFFSRYVGVGGGVRFNKGTVTVEDPLTVKDAELDAGHTVISAGVRFRF